MNTDDIFRIFHDPKRDARILDALQPSDFFPKGGDYFRIRRATIADRSNMGDVFLCIDSHDHAALGKKVLDTYTGLDPKRLGEICTFVTGDVIFYDCSRMWAALKASESAANGSEKL